MPLCPGSHRLWAAAIGLRAAWFGHAIAVSRSTYTHASPSDLAVVSAVGVSEDELGVGLDRIVDPAGRGPRIWFQVVPEKKSLKNRLHLDITVSGGRANPIETRRRLVDAEAQRLAALGATLVRVIGEDGVDHYAVAMRDPEGNEFDIN